MDIMISPILLISRLWSCSAHNTNYVRKLKGNLKTLETSFNSLRCQRDEVNRRIQMAESDPTKPAKRTNVNGGGCYICSWGRTNCWGAYKLGKSVLQKQTLVESLLKEGDFQAITYTCQPDPLQQIPTVHKSQ
ncbi:hypothetical protein MKW98_016669 [Papaver atlanticum]|uniref:Uncharacterized protein n=1 Tax=Papaver atlanticum TaxID=357466 RepID=A0AAD4SU03_9MAGN|nr:hypothetical protein MKW98_016669 [Papaver atlanticum]